MDKVSVVIPCFNDGKYIREAIESVNAQTYPDIEIIVCNDGSTDKYTIDVLGSLSKEGIKVIHLKNGGPAVARNIGISMAEGKYILPLDADDRIDKTYIEKAYEVIRKDDGIGAVYCYADLFGVQSGRWLLPDYSFESMLVDNVVFVTALFRKSDWAKVGGFCVDFKHGVEDYDFWLSIIELDKRIIQIPEVLFYYRIKDVSRTTKFNNNSQALQDTYEMIYDRHKALYKKHMDVYCKSIRRALVDRIIYSRQLEESLAFKEKLDQCPFLKLLLKKLYNRLFVRS